MEIKDLMKFVEEEVEHLQNKFGSEGKEFVFANALKLGEEVGELNEQILKKYNYQREKEMEGKLEHEIADVLIVTAVLAKSLDIDLEKALRDKMKIVEKRRK